MILGALKLYRITEDYTYFIVVANSPLITQYIPKEQKIIGCDYAVDTGMNEGTSLPK